MIDTLVILAPGLLGASVARAAKQRGLVRRIVIWSRRVETRLELEKQPWCDAVTSTAAEAVREASLVVLAPPVDRIVELLQEIVPHLPAGALVTDVGSVKGDISRLGSAAMKPGTHFVPAHPMAGSNKTGWEHSSPCLFEKRVCFLTPLASCEQTAVETVARFWNALGSDIVTTTPERHDEIVAHISHLPQVLASTLSAYLSSKDHDWRNYAGGGLRDTTRIADSDPTMWRAIMEHNHDEILRAIREYQDELQGFASALANRDYVDLKQRMERARAYRSRLQVQ